MIINAWLMNGVERWKIWSAIDASGQNAKQAQLDPGIAQSLSYRASQFEQSGL